MKKTLRRLLLVGSLALFSCNSGEGTYKLNNLTEEQKNAYQEYLDIDLENLTPKQKKIWNNFNSESNQLQMAKEIKDISERELREYIMVLEKYPWIRQDLFEYEECPNEIIEKLNDLSERDFLFYHEKFWSDSQLW